MRFSLKSGLLGIGVLGAMLGLLGRLWQRNPELVLMLVVWSPIAIVFLSALLMVRYHREIKRRPELSIAFPIIHLLAIGFFMTFLRPFVGPGKQNRIRWLPTAYLVGQRLDANIADSPVWKELEQRVLSNRVAKGELEPAFAKLFASWKTHAFSSTDSIPRTSYPVSRSDFLHKVAQRELISNGLLKQIADLRFGQPEVRSVRLREGDAQVDLNIVTYERRLLRVHYFSPWILVWDVTDARLGDKSLAITYEDAWSPGRVSFDATPGNHELVLNLTCGYVSRDAIPNSALDPGSPFAFGGGRAEHRRWPKTKRTWDVRLRVPIEVYGSDEKVISLVTDEKLNPTSKLRFDRLVPLRVLRRKDNAAYWTLLAKMTLDDASELPIAMSYDIFLLHGDERIPAGNYFAYKTKGDVITGAERSHLLQTLDNEKLKRGTLEFVPNPHHLERYPEVKEIWGRKLIMKDVELSIRGTIFGESTR